MIRVCLTLALACFALAVGIDWPSRLPPPATRAVGNFCCSLGLLFWALAFLQIWAAISKRV